MKAFSVLLACAISGAAFAQSGGHGHAPAHAPYAGLEQREIKALSPEQVGDLRAGRGMSLALAAELNGYPGPSHALEHADGLALTADQRTRTESLFREMQRGAAAIGARLIEAERRLDALFASGHATTDSVRAATADIAALQGELRALHLSFHVEMKQVLTPQQVSRYDVLRGYRR